MKEQRKAEIVDNCGFFAEDIGKSGIDTSVSLDFFGYEHCLPRHSYGPRVRLNYVIHVVIDGKGMLDYGGKRWMIGKGQMFILFPGEVTTYYADKEDPWYYCWFVYFIEDTCAKNTYFYEYATLDHVRLQQIPIYSNQS